MLVLLAVLALIASACTSGGTGTAAPEDAAVDVPAPTEPSDPVASSSTEVVETGPDPVDELMSTLTVEEKIGQLLMPVVWGTSGSVVSADEEAKNLRESGSPTPAEIVAKYHVGGIVYLEHNVESAEQLQGLSSDLQQASQSDTGIGLLIAIDQEGGRVNRIEDEVTVFDAAGNLAGDPLRAEENGYVTGQQVRQQGVNVVLAPVADVLEPGLAGFIDDRAFGDDPALVADMVRGSVAGLQQSGVAAAVKHWPGHGATPVDSHSALPVLDIDRGLWESRERVPFVAAIEEEVAIVLVGHLALPQLDTSSAPATVSPVLVDELLRDEMGFEGVVMSDALNMGAIDNIDRGEVVVQAVLAGIDILLMPPDLDLAYRALLDSVAEGRLSPEQLDTAVARVLRLKQDLRLLPESVG